LNKQAQRVRSIVTAFSLIAFVGLVAQLSANRGCLLDEKDNPNVIIDENGNYIEVTEFEKDNVPDWVQEQQEMWDDDGDWE